MTERCFPDFEHGPGWADEEIPHENRQRGPK
jgi:hypothetical protein